MFRDLGIKSSERVVSKSERSDFLNLKNIESVGVEEWMDAWMIGPGTGGFLVQSPGEVLEQCTSSPSNIKIGKAD